MTSPREGLPPCLVRYAEFEDRLVAFFDDSICGHNGSHRYGVSAGFILERKRDPGHPELFGAIIEIPPPIYMTTDDPDEAKAAFDKGAEYVRTGRME